MQSLLLYLRDSSIFFSDQSWSKYKWKIFTAILHPIIILYLPAFPRSKKVRAQQYKEKQQIHLPEHKLFTNPTHMKATGWGCRKLTKPDIRWSSKTIGRSNKILNTNQMRFALRASNPAIGVRIKAVGGGNGKIFPAQIFHVNKSDFETNLHDINCLTAFPFAIKFADT